MSIETIQDWNARLACCCGMPVCAVPSLVGQSRTISPGMCARNLSDWGASPQGGFPSGVATQDQLICRYFDTKKVDSFTTHGGYAFGDPLPSDYESTQTWTRKIDPDTGVCVIDNGTLESSGEFFCNFVNISGWETSTWEIEEVGDTIVVTNVRARNGTATHPDHFASWAHVNTYSGRITDHKAYLIDIAEKRFSVAEFTASVGSFSVALLTLKTPLDSVCPGLVTSIDWRKVRVRFRIPSTHKGDYYKITFDVALFPTDTSIPASFDSEDNVIVWTGPGDPANSTHASWYSDWFVIDPPTIAGQKRVVNIRFECWRSTRYGHKPQVTGEAFTPPS